MACKRLEADSSTTASSARGAAGEGEFAAGGCTRGRPLLVPFLLLVRAMLWDPLQCRNTRLVRQNQTQIQTNIREYSRMTNGHLEGDIHSFGLTTLVRRQHSLR